MLTVGVAFTESCKPEFCVKLKVQLDRYLVSEAHTTADVSGPAVGRTLGSANQIKQFLLRNGECAFS